MKNSERRGLHKVGISKNPDLRKSYIEKTMTGRMRIVGKWEVPSAYFLEQSIFILFAIFRVRLEKGISGRTEWLSSPMALTFLVIQIYRLTMALLPIILIFLAAIIFYYAG